MKVAKPPVHPLSAFVTIALDGVWHLIKVDSITDYTVLGAMVIIGSISLIAVTLIERYTAGQKLGKALCIAIAASVLAAVPYMVSPIIGVPFLAWAGVYQIKERFFTTPRIPKSKSEDSE